MCAVLFALQSAASVVQAQSSASDSLSLSPSGTLPILYINTVDTVPITSKTEYVDANYYLLSNTDSIESIGDADNQLPLQIRGRGNYTWTNFQKKPYRLKLAEKTKLMGMKKSRHFALLAHADDRTGFFRNTVGFELSRRLGLPFTPAQQPVEVVLNGDYIGLYFLTETIRVAKNRVDITEQANRETDPDSITGGWLIELDNHPEVNQIRLVVRDTGLGTLWFTYHSPDTISVAQRDYLRGQLEEIKRTVFTEDKSSTEWEELIDIQSLARFYFIMEVLDQVEAFFGSCYLYKDRGEDKWHFGPLWDLGHALNSWHDRYSYLYENLTWGKCIMAEFAKFPRLQQEVRRLWRDFFPSGYDHIRAFMTDFASQIAEAVSQDHLRWPKESVADEYESLQKSIKILNDKMCWLAMQWGSDSAKLSTIADDRHYDIGGRRIGRNTVGHGVTIWRVTDSDGTVRTYKLLK